MIRIAEVKTAKLVAVRVIPVIYLGPRLVFQS